MTYGEAFDFCIAGGKIKATKQFDTGELVSWIIRYDKSLDRFERQLLPKVGPVIHSLLFLEVDHTAAELDRWTFEDAEPEPPFEVRAEIDDDSALCVSIFWRGGLVIGTNRDDAVQLYEALGAAIKCAQCGAYLDGGGNCRHPKHKGGV